MLYVSRLSKPIVLAALLGIAATALSQVPTISGFSPTHGPVGTVITVTGTNLARAQKVFVNGLPLTHRVRIDDTHVQAKLPDGAVSGIVKVTTPKGEATSASNYTVDIVYSIASFTPWHGSPGTVVGFDGIGFTGTTALFFNGVKGRQLQILNDGHLNVTIPLGASTGLVKIRKPGLTYTTSTNFVIDGTGGGGTTGGSSGSSGGSSGGGGGTVVVPPNISIPAGAMTGHPRIFLRQQDVPTLRTWANAGNPVWNSLVGLANQAKSRMDNNQIVDNADDGSGNCPSPTESYSEIFAFMSIVHPDEATREDYANRAYSLIMPVINEAAKGMDDSQPYRMHTFATHNRASWYGEGFPLTVDWIYQKFTPEDKAKIRSVFLRWAQENCHANTTAQEHPEPFNVYNDPLLVDTKHKVRWAANNYYSNHARMVGLLSMALDDGDDVPATASDPPAGTLRKFVGDAMQAWLYQVKTFEETAGAGGVSPEGVGYGELTMRGISWLLLAMHTTGVDNPAVYGQVASAITSAYWDHEVADSYLHLQSPSQVIQESWVGPTYLPYQFSDSDKYHNTDYVRVFGSLAIYARDMGDMAKYNRLRWMIDNMPPGGVGTRHDRIYSALDSSSVSSGIFYFLSCDPAVPNASDPRPTMPTEYWAPGLSILSSRTDWTTNASWFVYKCSWNSMDHQFGDANSVAFWRGGEWLTKPRIGYGPTIACSDYQNTLAIQNPGSTAEGFWKDNSDRGSQYVYNEPGDPVSVLHSVGNGFVYAQGDTTALYNNAAIGANDVAHASRSTVYLKPDVVVTYDRATSKTAGKFKRFWLNTTALGTVNGHGASVTTDSGQKLFIDTLLPANATVTTSVAESLGGQPAVYEPMTHRYMAEDSSNPLDLRFLNVVQGRDAGGSKLPTLTVQSTSGTSFDGAAVGNTAIMFKRDMYAAFTGTTFTVPGTITKLIVTGLTPNAAYTVNTTTVNGNIQVTITAGGSTTADAGGVISM